MTAAAESAENSTPEEVTADVTEEVVTEPGAAAPAPASAPEPAAAPAPTPRPMPRPAPRPSAPASDATPAAPSTPASSESEPAAPAEAAVPAEPEEPWGRVDDDGTVCVRDGGQWRVVGQYPDGTAEEALAYFERKYADLVSEITLLEARHHRGGASTADLRGTSRAIREKVTDAAAVGDLEALVHRLDVLDAELALASESEAIAAREAVDKAIAERTAVVEQAEALAARDPKTVQWKQASAEMTSLFDQWQAQQRSGARLPKSTGQQLWKRFRNARATVDKHRREFYAELDEAHKIVRDRKAKLVEKAEALAPKGEDGIGTYRDLLEQWKAAGRAGKKADDALWARFKAAGDALYGARGEREAAEAEASREKIAERRALLDEAKAVADEKNLAKARTLLTGIQRRWDEVGRIFPRDKERALDDQLRKIEQALRTREDADWKRNNPETKARANDMTRQLTEAIEKLESELEAATASGDKRAIAKAAEALEARQGWLRALGG